jgi:hypothetical protein
MMALMARLARPATAVRGVQLLLPCVKAAAAAAAVTTAAAAAKLPPIKILVVAAAAGRRILLALLIRRAPGPATGRSFWRGRVINLK